MDERRESCGNDVRLWSRRLASRFNYRIGRRSISLIYYDFLLAERSPALKSCTAAGTSAA